MESPMPLPLLETEDRKSRYKEPLERSRRLLETEDGRVLIDAS